MFLILLLHSFLLLGVNSEDDEDLDEVIVEHDEKILKGFTESGVSDMGGKDDHQKDDSFSLELNHDLEDKYMLMMTLKKMLLNKVMLKTTCSSLNRTKGMYQEPCDLMLMTKKILMKELKK